MGGFEMGGLGCAGWARNSKGPQITPFCHQMGRHPTILDFRTGIRHRILARILPWGSWGLNPNFLFAYSGPQHAQKSIFWQGFEIIGTHSNGFGAPGGTRGAHRVPFQRPPKGPRGPRGAISCAAKGAQGAPAAAAPRAGYSGCELRLNTCHRGRTTQYRVC